MSLALDITGTATSNFVINESHLLSDIYNSNHETIYPKLGPLYQTGLVLTHVNDAGVNRTLVLGIDYNLIYPLLGIRASLENQVFGAVWLISERMTGQIQISYSALGGNWSYDTAQINNYQLTNYCNPNTHFAALVPSPEVYPANTAVSLETFLKIQASFVLVVTVRLGVVYKPFSTAENPLYSNEEIARLLALIANSNTPPVPVTLSVNKIITILNTEPVSGNTVGPNYVIQTQDPNRSGGFFARIFKTMHEITNVRDVTLMKENSLVHAEIQIDASGTVSIYGNVSLDSMTVRIH